MLLIAVLFLAAALTSEGAPDLFGRLTYLDETSDPFHEEAYDDFDITPTTGYPKAFIEKETSRTSQVIERDQYVTLNKAAEDADHSQQKAINSSKEASAAEDHSRPSEPLKQKEGHENMEVTKQGQQVNHVHTTEKPARPAPHKINSPADSSETTAYPTVSTELPEQQHTITKYVEKETAEPKQPSFESPAVPTTINKYPTESGSREEETSQNPKVTEQYEVIYDDTTGKASHPAWQEISSLTESPETAVYSTVSTELSEQQHTITKYVEKETAEPKQPSFESPAVPTTINEYPTGSGSHEEETSQNPKVTEQHEVIYDDTTGKASHPAWQEISSLTESSETVVYSTVSTELSEQQHTITKYVEKETAESKQPSFESPAVPTTINEYPTGSGSREEETSQNPKVTEQHEVIYDETTGKASHPAWQEISGLTESSETAVYSTVSTELSEQQHTITKYVEKERAEPKQPSFESPAMPTTINEYPAGSGSREEETSQNPKVTERHEVIYDDTTGKASHPAWQEISGLTESSETAVYSTVSTELSEQQHTTTKYVEKETAEPKQPSFESPAVPTTINEYPAGSGSREEETSQNPKVTERHEVIYDDTTGKASHPAWQEISGLTESSETAVYSTVSTELSEQQHTTTKYVEKETAEPKQPSFESPAMPTTINEYPAGSGSREEETSQNPKVTEQHEVIYDDTTGNASHPAWQEISSLTESSETAVYSTVSTELSEQQHTITKYVERETAEPKQPSFESPAVPTTINEYPTGSGSREEKTSQNPKVTEQHEVIYDDKTGNASHPVWQEISGLTESSETAVYSTVSTELSEQQHTITKYVERETAEPKQPSFESPAVPTTINEYPTGSGSREEETSQNPKVTEQHEVIYDGATGNASHPAWQETSGLTESSETAVYSTVSTELSEQQHTITKYVERETAEPKQPSFESPAVPTTINEYPTGSGSREEKTSQNPKVTEQHEVIYDDTTGNASHPAWQETSGLTESSETAVYSTVSTELSEQQHTITKYVERETAEPKQPSFESPAVPTTINEYPTGSGSREEKTSQNPKVTEQHEVIYDDKTGNASHPVWQEISGLTESSETAVYSTVSTELSEQQHTITKYVEKETAEPKQPSFESPAVPTTINEYPTGSGSREGETSQNPKVTEQHEVIYDGATGNASHPAWQETSGLTESSETAVYSTVSTELSEQQHTITKYVEKETAEPKQPSFESPAVPTTINEYPTGSGSREEKTSQNPKVTEQHEVIYDDKTGNASHPVWQEISGLTESSETAVYSTVSTELSEQQHTITKYVEKETAEPKQPSFESPAVPTTINEYPTGSGSREEETSQNPKVTEQHEVIYDGATGNASHPAWQETSGLTESSETAVYSTVSTELSEQQHTITKYVEKETAEPKQPSFESPAVPTTINEYPTGSGSREEKTPQNPKVTEQHEVIYDGATGNASHPAWQETSGLTESSETAVYSTVSTELSEQQHTITKYVERETAEPKQPSFESPAVPTTINEYPTGSGSREEKTSQNPKVTEQHEVIYDDTTGNASHPAWQETSGLTESSETAVYSTVSTELSEQQHTITKYVERETAEPKQPSFESPAVPTTINEYPTGSGSREEKTSQNPKVTEQHEVIYDDTTGNASHPAWQETSGLTESSETAVYSTVSTELSEQQHTITKYVEKETAEPKQPSFESPAVPTTINEYPTGSGSREEETSQNPKVTEQHEVIYDGATGNASHPAWQETSGLTESSETAVYSTVSTELSEQQHTITKYVEKETAEPKQPSFESPAVPTTINEYPTGSGSREEKTPQNPKVTEQHEVIYDDTTGNASHPVWQEISGLTESSETAVYSTVSTELSEQQHTFTRYVEKETAEPKQPSFESSAVPMTESEYPVVLGTPVESPGSPEVTEKFQEMNYVYTTKEAAFSELQENSGLTASSGTTGYEPVSESFKPSPPTETLEQALNSQGIKPGNVATEHVQEEDFHSNSEVAAENSHAKCSCDIKKVWIDLVFVVDVSRAVSVQDFFAIGNLLTYYFRQMPISQELGQHTRVSIVFGAEKAYTVAKLSAFANSDEAIRAVKRVFQQRSALPVGDGQRFEITAALTETWRIINDEGRPHKPVAVVLFSATEVTCSYYYAHHSIPKMRSADPCRISTHLMEGNNVLITVALKFGGLKHFPRIKLGDRCFSVVNDIDLPKNLLQKICDANCFCPRPYIQYKVKNSCVRYAECFYMHGIALTYRAAVDTCKAQASELVDIFDEDKDQFIAGLHQNGHYAPYWIGLKKENGERVWSTGKKLRNGHYTNWADGHPLEDGNCTIVKQPNNGVAQWISQRCDGLRSYYFSCQRRSCDTNTDYSNMLDDNGIDIWTAYD